MLTEKGPGSFLASPSPILGRLAASAFLIILLSASALLGDERQAELIQRPSAPNETIRQLAQRARLSPGGTSGRLEGIIDLIFSQKDGLGFTYRARPTLTAAEAVEVRAGNCLTLVNLVVAIARSAGIDAEYVEVEDFEAFYRRKGTVVRTTHVIGGVEISGSMTYIDFLPGRPKPYRRLRPISDRRAAALFYNALAAEAILVKNYELAEIHFADAFAVDKGSADTWNNYAVLQRRRGDLEAAIRSLERAHRLEPRSLPPIENLGAMYRRAGLPEKAAEFEALALKEKTRNPYFLLLQALEHLKDGDYEEAEEPLRRARRLEPDEPEIYVALGRVELGKGNRRAADRLFDQARKKSEPRTAGFQALLQSKIDRLLAASEELSRPAKD
jgi:Flp pilus assembly protein TadD